MPCQTYTRLPSSIRTLWMGFRNRNTRYTVTVEHPPLSVALPAFAVSEKHLARYKALCGLESKGVPLFYPLTLAYPLCLRLLSQKALPFSMFRMLNREVTVSSYGPVPSGVPLRIHTAVSSQRETNKGIDLCLTTDMFHENKKIWCCINTFFFKGAGTGKPQAVPESAPCHLPSSPVPSEKPAKVPETVSWFLPHGNGFRFARACGDSNGLHYSHWYAKMQGFEGAFAQPMLVLDKCLDKAGWNHKERKFSATVRLKGQLYYGRELTLSHEEVAEGKHIHLFCEGNKKPCISVRAKNSEG
ncbi:hypothetical protein [Desulfoluna spongiiphila]|uniref:MaoC like domain-containing protein n=1 Tax=Desulfoluna spongiiphila TaxID=419481 RepID=A0A1G5II04_9BACT|nr:hypothetical protein [Desulfoluna spongiiphila]SCY75706.1 hypothetical protein SAMN05216233_12032 [Desulfoluna spongiiphila]